MLGPEHRDTATSRYELAGLLARQGRRDEALRTLNDAVDHGLPAGTDLYIDQEDDFKSLHGDPRYVALLAHAKERAGTQKTRRSAPCSLMCDPGEGRTGTAKICRSLTVPRSGCICGVRPPRLLFCMHAEGRC